MNSRSVFYLDPRKPSQGHEDSKNCPLTVWPHAASLLSPNGGRCLTRSLRPCASMALLHCPRSTGEHQITSDPEHTSAQTTSQAGLQHLSPHLWHLVPGVTHTSCPFALHRGHRVPFILAGAVLALVATPLVSVSLTGRPSTLRRPSCEGLRLGGRTGRERVRSSGLFGIAMSRFGERWRVWTVLEQEMPTRQSR